jgi:hypothetical protein
MLLVGDLRQHDRVSRHANANHETSGFGEAMGEVLNVQHKKYMDYCQYQRDIYVTYTSIYVARHPTPKYYSNGQPSLRVTTLPASEGNQSSQEKWH